MPRSLHVPKPRLGWQIQFLALAATWGASFLFIKVLAGYWPAVWVALARVALGTITLVALVVARGERLPFQRRLWLHLTVASLVFNVIPFTLFAFGEKHVSSVVAGLWNATTPLWVLLAVLIAFDEEHPARERTVGLALGFVGVTLLLGPWRGLGTGELIGHLACAAAAACYGLGFPYTRRYLANRAESGVVLAAGQLVCATVLLAVLAPFTRAPTTHIGLDGLGSVLALGMLGTGTAYVLNYAIVRAAGATIASTVTYVIPVFSTALGVIVLGEALRWNQPSGVAVLFVGIAVSQGRLRLPARVQVQRPTPERRTTRP
jgi:drug/metabolite transporter (DMT)-like permease